MRRVPLHGAWRRPRWPHPPWRPARPGRRTRRRPRRRSRSRPWSRAASRRRSSATGTVVSRNDARLAAEVTGRLDWVAEPGTKVAKGAPLARVDARALELQLKENDAQISRLAANAELLDTQLARLNALPEGIASKSQIDEAAARLAMARHELDQARATRESTQHLIARATIRAPFPGYVAERIRQLGEFVSAGTEVLRLTDTENVEVVARAPVAEAGHLAAGQAVTVHGACAGPAEQDPRDRAGRRRALAHDRGAHRDERHRLADRLGRSRGPAGRAAERGPHGAARRGHRARGRRARVPRRQGRRSPSASPCASATATRSASKSRAASRRAIASSCGAASACGRASRSRSRPRPPRSPRQPIPPRLAAPAVARSATALRLAHFAPAGTLARSGRRPHSLARGPARRSCARGRGSSAPRARAVAGPRSERIPFG